MNIVLGGVERLTKKHLSIIGYYNNTKIQNKITLWPAALKVQFQLLLGFRYLRAFTLSYRQEFATFYFLTVKVKFKCYSIVS